MVLSVASVVFSSTEGGGASGLPVITGPLNLTPPLSPQGVVTPLALAQQREHKNIDRNRRHSDMSARSNMVVQHAANSADKVDGGGGGEQWVNKLSLFLPLLSLFLSLSGQKRHRLLP